MSYVKRLMEEICYLYRDGFTASEISEKVHLPESTVREAINDYYEPMMNESEQSA